MVLMHNRELKQVMYLSTRAPAGSKSSRYRWRMMASDVLVSSQERQSMNFDVLDLKQELLTPSSFAIYNGSTSGWRLC